MRFGLFFFLSPFDFYVISLCKPCGYYPMGHVYSYHFVVEKLKQRYYGEDKDLSPGDLGLPASLTQPVPFSITQNYLHLWQHWLSALPGCLCFISRFLYTGHEPGLWQTLLWGGVASGSIASLKFVSYCCANKGSRHKACHHNHWCHLHDLGPGTGLTRWFWLCSMVGVKMLARAAVSSAGLTVSGCRICFQDIFPWLHVCPGQ